METATFVVAIVILIGVVILIARSSEIENTLRSAIGLLTQISDSMGMIAESKRLSTVLTIEAKKDLNIKPEEFEAKKTELRTNMLEALEKGMTTYRSKNGRIESPDTVAFIVLDHSGFDQFVTSEVRSKAKSALARLIANQNIPSAKRFITVLANNL